jgi:hypothetical protein
MRKTLCYTSRIGFYFNNLLPHHVFHPKPYFFTVSFDDWQNMQWQLGLVWLWRQKRLPVALWQIGAQVLVGAHLSFRSHQFIYNVLEYIHADGISAF